MTIDYNDIMLYFCARLSAPAQVLEATFLLIALLK